MQGGAGGKGVRIAKAIARVTVGVLLLLLFGAVLGIHLMHLLMGGLTVTDLWELPATLSIGTGMVVCGCGLLVRRALVAWGGAGLGLVIAGCYMVMLSTAVSMTGGRWYHLSGTAAQNMVGGFVVVVVGVVLLVLGWRQARRRAS